MTVHYSLLEVDVMGDRRKAYQIQREKRSSTTEWINKYFRKHVITFHLDGGTHALLPVEPHTVAFSSLFCYLIFLGKLSDHWREKKRKRFE